jgi:hypothetical protein
MRRSREPRPDRAASEELPAFRVGDANQSEKSAGEAAAADSTTYYGLPVVKEPVWIWAVPTYFAVGGAAGASLVLGAAAQLADRDGLDDLVRWSRRIGAAGAAVGGSLLIVDLGRPGRFLNMLRVFRPTSPLNVGSWLLAGASATSAAAALLAGSKGSLRTAGDAAGLAGYTAVLLSNTVVPLWSAVRRTLPSLFVASAASSAGALATLLPLSPRSRGAARAFALCGLAAEVVAARVVDRSASRDDRVGRPLHEGLSGGLWTAAEAGSAAALLLMATPGRWGRRLRPAAAAAAIASTVAMRFAVFLGGKASARDPLATFEQQRKPKVT